MEAILEAVERESRGKNEARRLRAGGRMPAVVYGGDKPEGKPITVDPKVLLRILHSELGANTLIALKMPGAADARVLVKEYQLDPVSHQILHADFYRVAMDKPIRVTVPVVTRGEAPGVKQQGGILDFVHREIDIECLPTDIPEHVEVDVAELMLGQNIRVRDVLGAVTWTAVSDPEMMLVHVIALKVEEPVAAVEAPAEAAAEPEVIKKGKVEKPEEAED
jgi:large subunit ribosomal protein L25